MKDCCDNCKEGKECCSVHEGGMGVLSTDQADILQGIVLKNKTKNLKAILNVAIKSGYFKNVDKKELLGYIDGAKQFVKYMKSHPMESVNEKMGPEQYHQYMQYVFDTQFKTADEKKMKKSIIKKINVGQKKKGLPVFKESDLGYTYKKGKTVKVKHKKSGKELVIVDKPAVRKKYEKLGFTAEANTKSIDGKELYDFLQKRFKMSKSKAIATMKKHKMDLSFLKKESVNEAKEYKPEKRRKLWTGEVEVMKGKGSRQKWFYLKNKEDVKQLIRLGRNSAFPTGITNNNSKVKFDTGWHINESVNEGFSSLIVKKAVDIAKKMSGDMTGAVKKIEKIKKGLSDDSKVKATLRTANESVNETIEPAGNMAKVANIVRNSQAAKLSGVMIDMQSANLLMKLWDAVSDKDKEKMNKLNAKVLTTVIKKLWSRVNLKLPI